MVVAKPQLIFPAPLGFFGKNISMNTITRICMPQPNKIKVREKIVRMA
jgi:hypothetical protein